MRTITREELEEKLDGDEDFVLINVLSPESFAEDHIDGSINVPYEDDDFTQRVEEKAGSKDAEIIVYCASFDCSASTDAAETLEEDGFTNVADYEGGMADWNQAHEEDDLEDEYAEDEESDAAA